MSRYYWGSPPDASDLHLALGEGEAALVGSLLADVVGLPRNAISARLSFAARLHLIIARRIRLDPRRFSLVQTRKEIISTS